MKVLFIQNVPSVGKIDDVKEVNDGYARNFLFARNLAIPATAKALSELQGRKQKKIKNYELELKEQQSLADKLSGYELVIKEKTSEEGIFYAAIGSQKISDILKKQGLMIEKNKIIVKSIKEPGEYDGKIKLGHGLESDIKIIAVRA